VKPPLSGLAQPGPKSGARPSAQSFNSVVNPTEAPVLDQIAPRAPARWRRKTVAAALVVAVAVTALVTWLKVAHTIRHPHPVKVTKQPRVSALVWSGRVFVDPATFKRWLDARDVPYEQWARTHPHAVAILERAHGTHP
jgi:hypothetical protein